MVLDGGGRFSPAGIVRVHTLSLLLLSQSAHDRAAVDSDTQDKRQTRRKHTDTWVQYKPRQVGINSIPL